MVRDGDNVVTGLGCEAWSSLLKYAGTNQTPVGEEFGQLIEHQDVVPLPICG